MSAARKSARPKILAIDVGGSHVKCLLSGETTRRKVHAVVEGFSAALLADEIVVGGGQADRLKKLPPRSRAGTNAAAFVGGYRLWDESPPAKSSNTYKDLT